MAIKTRKKIQICPCGRSFNIETQKTQQSRLVVSICGHCFRIKEHSNFLNGIKGMHDKDTND